MSLKKGGSFSSGFTGLSGLMKSSRGFYASTAPNSFMKKKYSSPFLADAQSKVFPQFQEHEFLASRKSNSFANLFISAKSKSKKLRTKKKKHRRNKKKKLKSKFPLTTA